MTRRAWVDARVDWQQVKLACEVSGTIGRHDGVRPLLMWAQRVLHDRNPEPGDLRAAAEVLAAAAMDFDRLEAGVTQSPPRPGAAMRYRQTHRFVYLNPDEMERAEVPWIEGPCMTKEEWAEAQEAARARRREETRRVVAKMVSERPATVKRLLSVDQDAREGVARQLGGVVANGIARRVPCPSCGRKSVWFAIEKGWAHCDHRSSCGFDGPLDIVAGTTGSEA